MLVARLREYGREKYVLEEKKECKIFSRGRLIRASDGTCMMGKGDGDNTVIRRNFSGNDIKLIN